jgi:hypothetical protein
MKPLSNLRTKPARAVRSRAIMRAMTVAALGTHDHCQ